MTEKETMYGSRCDENYPNEKAILYYLTNLAQRADNHRGNYYSSSLKRKFPFNTNGIVKIYGEWENKQFLYYAMEYCGRCDLMTYFVSRFNDPNGHLQKLAHKCANAPIDKPLAINAAGSYSPWLRILQDIF